MPARRDVPAMPAANGKPEPAAKVDSSVRPGRPQTPAKPSGGSGGTSGSALQTIRFEQDGWPVVPGEPRALEAVPSSPSRTGTGAAAPAGETAAAGNAMRTDSLRVPGKAATPAAGAARRADAGRAELASGMAIGSPLLEVFQATHAPGAFKDLGGLVIGWRMTTHGPRGEVIGSREITHTADCAFSERDRLEHQDGRTFARIGGQVFAEKQGMPAPTLLDSGQWELALFGLQLRMPWLFGDSKTFAVMAREVDERDGERLVRVVVERRPPPALDVMGPSSDPAPRDRYEILYEPSTGLPRQFTHRFAASKQNRTVLLEDWRDVEGVRMPFRRVYLDDALRATTVLEIQRVERQRVTERDFRLH